MLTRHYRIASRLGCAQFVDVLVGCDKRQHRHTDCGHGVPALALNVTKYVKAARDFVRAEGPTVCLAQVEGLGKGCLKPERAEGPTICVRESRKWLGRWPLLGWFGSQPRHSAWARQTAGPSAQKTKNSTSAAPLTN